MRVILGLISVVAQTRSVLRFDRTDVEKKAWLGIRARCQYCPLDDLERTQMLSLWRAGAAARSYCLSSRLILFRNRFLQCLLTHLLLIGTETISAA